MIKKLRILISEPNFYYNLGIYHGLSIHFTHLNVELDITTNLFDKNVADVVIVSAEQDKSMLRYLIQRQSVPACQLIFIIKDKTNPTDSLRFKNMDGIFYRFQKIDKIIKKITQELESLFMNELKNNKNKINDILFTCRELEILRYLSIGQRSCEISQHLRISQKTISAHKRSAMKKIGLTRSSDLNFWLLYGGRTQLHK